MNKNKICQSCGMPLSKDPQGGGTNADGTKSDKYCSYCLRNGVLEGEGMTVGEFQEHCRRVMRQSGHGAFSSWLFSRGLSRLERWKSS